MSFGLTLLVLVVLKYWRLELDICVLPRLHNHKHLMLRYKLSFNDSLSQLVPQHLSLVGQHSYNVCSLVYFIRIDKPFFQNQ